MQVTCVCCYRNEADILEAFVRQTAIYCDALILLDHGSTDESPEIARQLLHEGLPLRLFSDPTLGNVETDQTNRLLKLAANEFGADWILSLDADEFISGPPDNSFLPTAIEDETICLKIRSRSYYAHPSDRAELLNPVERITHRLASEEATDPKVFVPGWLVRRGTGFLTQGKHQYFLHTEEAPASVIEGVTLAHFSLRSPSQYAMKLASKQLQKWRHISKQGDELTYYNRPYRLLKESYTRFQESFASHRLAYKIQHHDDELVPDPIAYRGGSLRYTPGNCAGPDRFVREVLELAEKLARTSPPFSSEACTNGATPAGRLTIELTSGPSPGHTEVLNVAVDSTQLRTISLSADCPPDTTELQLSLRADPGLIEISEIILNYAGAGRRTIRGIQELQKIVRVSEGGAVIAPTDVFRILISKDPVRMTLSGWRKPDDLALPDELLLRLRVEHRLVPAVVVSPAVLNAIAAEQRALATCRAQLEAALREVALYKEQLSKSTYSVGSVINFAANGNSILYVGEGWSSAEEWGTWTEGERAVLHIRFEEPPKRPLRLHALLHPFLHDTHAEVQVRVSLNGEELVLWKLDSPEVATLLVDIPADKLRASDCEIVFDIANPASPLQLGISNDSRCLGIGMRSVDFQWHDALSEAGAVPEPPAVIAEGKVS